MVNLVALKTDYSEVLLLLLLTSLATSVPACCTQDGQLLFLKVLIVIYCGYASSVGIAFI